MIDDIQSDVTEDSTPNPAVVTEADSSPVPLESSSAESTADGVTVEEVKAPETQEEVDPLKDVPTLEELEKQAAEKVPYAQALANLRTAYEGVKPQLDEVKAFEPWKPVVEAIGDPAQAQTAHELIGLLHSPVEGEPNGYSTKPFLDRVDQESPGVANQLFADLLAYVVPDDNGKMDTLVRHLYRSHGLDPDRAEDYRNIDTLRASGVVTSDQLAKIDERYHEAFKALPQEARDDILALKETNPALADQYLRNAERSLASERFEQEQRQREEQAQQTQQVQFEQQLQAAVYNDIIAEVKTIHDSIYQNLSSQFTFSSDATQNSLEHRKIMATLATLQNPAYRFVAEEALKSVGVTLNGFDELANRWEDRRSAYTQYKTMGDNLRANKALSEATAAKQQILAKLNDYALRLAKASGQRAAGAAAQTESQLTAATARFVPSGTGQVTQGTQNPYAQNPHPIGSQEYFAFNRKIDKEYNLNGASVFS